MAALRAALARSAPQVLVAGTAAGIADPAWAAAALPVAPQPGPGPELPCAAFAEE